jgi:multiple antibiotic resistance protein
MLSWTEYARFAIALFSILTPFAAIPIFLSLTGGMSHAQRAHTARLATLTVMIVLLVSAVAGDSILRAVGTSLDSFRVGGGIVLLLLALSMLTAQVSPVKQTPAEAAEAGQRANVGVVPIGLPLLVGPGSISTVIIEMNRERALGHWGMTVAIIVAISGVVWVFLLLAEPIGQRLGLTGLNVLNRLFGLLLAAIAIEIMAAGLRALFPGLG